MVILPNGQMLVEGYYNGGAETRLELLASGSKSFSCVLAAAAVREQIIPDINVLASSRITSWAPGGSAPNTGFKQQIRVRDLLDLSSGLSAAGASGPGLYSVDSYAQAINVRSSFGPDTHLVYTPNHFQAFLAFFELATGGTLQQDGGVSGGRDPAEFLQTAVLDQIGVAIPEWRRDIVGNPILAGGAFMTARDWARYGQLVLQNGRWNGAQILPAAIMSECRTPQSPSAANIYGLGWWLNLPAENFNPDEDSIPLQSGEAERLANGGKFIPTAPDDLFYAWGAGNMKLFIVPSRDLVVVRQGGSTDDIEFFRLLFSS
jgi:CubicO group peptidase (beta-lactamase class C family)